MKKQKQKNLHSNDLIVVHFETFEEVERNAKSIKYKTFF